MAMIPAAATRESVRVDLPWSTWAITDMLRMLFLYSICRPGERASQQACRTPSLLPSLLLLPL